MLAQTQSAPDQVTLDARAAYRRGLDAYNADHYEEARKAFSEAHELKPDELEILRALGAAEVRSEHWLDGARHLRRWLAESRKGSPQERNAVVQLHADAQEHLGRFHIRVDEVGANVSIDGEFVGRAPLEDDLYVTPGAHTVRAEKDGKSASANTSVPPGGNSYVPLVLGSQVDGKPAALAGGQLPHSQNQAARFGIETKLALVKPPGAIEQPLALRDGHAGILLLGSGIALGGAGLGAIFLRSASRADDDANRLSLPVPCTTNCGGPSYAQDTRNEAQRSRTSAVVSFSLGGVAALGTAAFFLWVPEEPGKSRSTRPIVSGALVAAAGLATGIASTIEANGDRDSVNANIEAFRKRGLAGRGCTPDTDSVSQCADLLRSNRDYDEHRDLAIGGFSLAGAAALGTAAYLLWPDSSSAIPKRATVSFDGRSRTLVVFGQF